MAITYRVIERGEPGVTGGGTKQYYAIAYSRSKVTLLGLSKSISRMSSLTRPDIMAVLEALTVLVPEHLQMGRIVELGGLGSLGVSLSSAPSVTADEVDSHNVVNVRLRFRPGKELRDALSNATFEKVA
ncbi:DNA-binding protein [bacterium]|nr:DNA-binding protein [bacterium]